MTDREVRKAHALDVESTPREEKPILASESEAKPEETSEKAQEKELIEKSEPISKIANESIVESIPEPAKPMKSAKSKSAKLAKSVKKIETEPEVEPVKESESASIPESTQESEPAVKSKSEPIVDSENIAALEVANKPVAENAAPTENSEMPISDTVENENVRQEKEDAIKRVEKYLAKAAQEAQSEEERQKAAEEERLQLEAEEEKAWEALQLAQERKAEMDQILEIERLEAERKAEELKQQADREEIEKKEQEERRINQARLTALIQEQERLVVEEHLEEIQQQKQEQEAADITQFSTDELKDFNCAENPADPDITDQEKEEKVCDVTTDDETRVEEETAPEEHIEITEDAFVEEPAGAENKMQSGPMSTEVVSNVEEITSGEEFEWGDQDA